VRSLHEGPELDWPAKARHLAAAAANGISVPMGWVVPMAIRLREDELERCLRERPLIARAALLGEDEGEASGAGLGLSIRDLTTAAELHDAFRDIDAHRRDPWLVRYRGGPRAEDRIIVQHQVEADWLIVAVIDPPRATYVEAHAGAVDPLARGTTPTYMGRLDRWSEPAARSVRTTIEQVLESHAESAHGLDVELVVDPTGGVHVVQVRPLVQSLTPSWSTFRSAVEAAGQLDRLLEPGTLTLDAEHNPEPLSVAHGWLMDWLARARPQAGHPTVLAGWLFVRTLPRALRPSSRPGAPTRTPGQALTHLVDVLIPDARTRLTAIERSLVGASPHRTLECLNHALEAFLAMIDAYLECLVPARRAHKVADVNVRASVRGRGGFLDVLPARWDIASPPLGSLGSFPDDEPAVVDLDDDLTAATLLAEWDDHLFALGLAPVRAVFLHAGALLGLREDVFWLRGDELEAELDRASLDRKPDLEALCEARRHRHAEWASLRPPLRIEDGEPTPFRPDQHLQGLAIGPDFEGPIAQRRDLEHLLQDPPSRDAIVVLPALTAQAAVALASLELRAVCCEYGGALSHAALMTRELQLSALIGCRGCIDIPNGAAARIDTRSGRLRLFAPAQRHDHPHR